MIKFVDNHYPPMPPPPSEVCLLSNNVYDYRIVSQGKTTIPSVDDAAEFEDTDVRIGIITKQKKNSNFNTSTSNLCLKPLSCPDQSFSTSKTKFFFFFLLIYQLTILIYCMSDYLIQFILSN